MKTKEDRETERGKALHEDKPPSQLCRNLGAENPPREGGGFKNGLTHESFDGQGWKSSTRGKATHEHGRAKAKKKNVRKQSKKTRTGLFLQLSHMEK